MTTRKQEKDKKKDTQRGALTNADLKEKNEDDYDAFLSSSSSSHDASLIPIRIASKDKKHMRYRYLTLCDNGKWYHVDAKDLVVKAPMLVQSYEKHSMSAADKKNEMTEQSMRKRKEKTHAEKKNATDEKREQRKKIDIEEKKRTEPAKSTETRKKTGEEKKKADQSKSSSEAAPTELGDLPPFLPLYSPLFWWGTQT